MRTPLKRGGPLRSTKPLISGASLGRNLSRSGMPPCTSIERKKGQDDKSAAPRRAPPRRETGFTAAQRLSIRARAGDGEVDEARCEACGRWLGRYHGQVQHIRARKNGGSRLLNSLGNGALLCGTPETLCHGACEARDPHMRAMGFWLCNGDPPTPIMLHGVQGGVLMWLDDSGGYSRTPPQEAA